MIPSAFLRKWEQQWQLSFEPLEELLATSDIITLHVPLTEENHHMIGAREIAAMKDGAIPHQYLPRRPG